MSMNPADTLARKVISVTAADIMTRKVVSITPDTSIGRVAKIMAEHGISALPVCAAGDELVGMISEGDLLQPFGEKYRLRRAWWLNLLAEGVDLVPEFESYLRLDHHRAKDLMKRDVITATMDTPVSKVADLLREHRIKRVPIVEGSRLVGIVSRADVVRALASKPELLDEPV